MKIFRLFCFVSWIACSLCLFLSTGQAKSGHSQPEDWEQKIGKMVSVRGTARNAKLGAVVLSGRQPIYLQGMNAWDDKTVNQKVLVTGVLRKFSPPVATKKNGEYSAGVTKQDTAYRLEDPSWVPLGN
jgi:hypothetical protein